MCHQTLGNPENGGAPKKSVYQEAASVVTAMEMGDDEKSFFV